MHLQQMKFCKSVLAKLPEHFTGKIVRDFGSADLNGNNQYLFTDCEYKGIDIAPHDNVDIVCKTQDYVPDKPIDTIISTEMLEHDMYWDKSISHMVNILKPGGLLVFTCATTGRPEHGTRRSDPGSSPLTTQDETWGDYYKNLTEQDIRSILDIESLFSDFEFSIGQETHDLYFWGVKR